MPCPGHGQHQKLGEPCPLSLAVSPEQQYTASHQRVGQQRADGHRVNQGFQVEEEGQESCRDEKPFQPPGRAGSTTAVPISAVLPLCPPRGPLTPAATGLKHLDELVMLQSLVQSILPPPAWQLREAELVPGTASRPRGPHPQREDLSLGGEILLSYWQARGSVLSC